MSGLVFSFELLNGAVEQIANFISPQVHPAIKRLKDASVAAVLIAVVAVLIIGIATFLLYM